MNASVLPHDVPSLRRFVARFLAAGALVSVLGTAIQPCHGQVTPVGGVARNFTVTDRRTGQPIRLHDYAGSVVVMDFFAYWCGPCQTSSPDLKANVDDYYESRNGNANGVPVVVLSVNIETGNPPATDAFIDGFDLHRVADDFSQVAFSQFSDGFIPLFVIINGVSGLPTYRQWEVLYRDSGYPGATAIRSIVDSVTPPNEPGPATVRIGPASLVRQAGGAAVFNVLAAGTLPITYRWFKNDAPLNVTSNRLTLGPLTLNDRGSYRVTVMNSLGSQSSSPASLMIYGPGVTNVLASTDVPKALPDYPQAGASSVLEVEEDWEVTRLGVQASFVHSWQGDLAVALVSPAGLSVTIRPATGQSGSQLNLNLADIPAFVGQSARGTWTLRVVDTATQDVGTLQSWSLSIGHPAPGLPYATWAAGYPEANLTDPAGDHDGDGVPNFVEYLMDGFSPTGADPLPLPATDPADADYMKLVVRLRPNTERGIVSIQMARPTVNSAWSEVATAGGAINVDRTVPNIVTVKFRRTLAPTFFRLKGVRL